MKITVIIAEYNPFHNGHSYHIELAKKFGDPIVVLMSGSFVQRGEPAIFDKYKRAETAVKNGVDAVFELPAPFSFAPADKYAFGAFKTIDSLNAEIRLSFGSESGNIDEITNTAKILFDEPNEYKRILKENLKKGFSLAKSRSNALFAYAEKEKIKVADVTQPNNILAVEYAKQNLSFGEKVELVTHERIGEYKGKSNYGFESASEIRKKIKNNEQIYSVPEETARLVKETPYRLDDSIYLFSIIRENPKTLARIFDVNEGLENRLYESVKKANSLKQAVENCVCGRYSESRIRRIMTNVLLDVTKSDFQKAIDEPPVFNLLSAKKSSVSLLSCVNGQTVTSQSALSRIDSIQSKLMAKSQDYYKILKGNSFDHTIFVD